jgi:dTDP-4-amino-4,6-dideoxygalactose transaminase
MVKYYNIDKEFIRIEIDFLKKIKKHLRTGNFILGENLYEFEKKISNLLKSKYVLGVANGTDALELAMLAIDIKKDDEVITAPNSFISTANAIINVGAKPVFADIDENFNLDPNKIEKCITGKTKVIMPVHLNGFPSCMNKIKEIAKKYNLYVIEDVAQSILSKFGNKYLGTIGDIGCFSLHPTKNLGALGDAGFITTQNKKLFFKLKYLRNHGLGKSDEIVLVGRNSRLDEIQAIALNLKLKFLKKDTIAKRKNAKIYFQELQNLPNIKLPKLNCCEIAEHVYHRFVIRCIKDRDLLFKFLLKKNIEVKIHYSKNIHDQEPIKKICGRNKFPVADKLSREIISLPINQFTTSNEIKKICNYIKIFYS